MSEFSSLASWPSLFGKAVAIEFGMRLQGQASCLPRLVDPTGRSAQYDYDTLGRLTRVTRPEGDITDNTYVTALMRHIVRLPVLLLFSASVATTPMAQTLYKSVRPDGKVVYGDRPPAEGRIEKTMKFENLPSSALPASTSSYVEQLQRMKASSLASTPPSGVVLYAAAWCGYCKNAKAYLVSKGVAYQEIDIDTKNGMAAFAQAGGGGGVPLLFAGGQRVQGFSPAAYDALFVNRK